MKNLMLDDLHAHAVVCFSDPDIIYPIDADKVSEAYNLTESESYIAVSIANGLSPDDIATINNVALSTVRGHIKSIYSKLGINKQGDLIKIILTGPFVNTI